ncbi:MAG: hypothetical protein Aurels2KO_36890 [Aureliella sp.]
MTAGRTIARVIIENPNLQDAKLRFSTTKTNPLIFAAVAWYLLLTQPTLGQGHARRYRGEQSHGTAPYTDPELATASPTAYGKNSQKYGDSGYGDPDYAGIYSDGRYKRNRSRDFVHMPDYQSNGLYRQPSAMIVQSDSRLLIATKKTGELYDLDPQTGDACAVFGPSAIEFGHLVQLDEEHLLASDNAAEQIVVLRKIRSDGAKSDWEVTKRIAAPGTVGDLVYDSDRHRVYASGVWSRRLYQWQLDSSFTQWRTHPTIDLPFGGGCIALLPHRLTTGKHQAVVADAFGSNLAIVNLNSAEIESHQHYDHNIKSMFIDAERGELVYGHQLLNEFIPAIRGEITWGGMLSNNIRQYKLASLLSAETDIDAGNVFTPLGFTGQGGGQPTSIRRLSSGRFIATLGGTSKLAIQTDNRFQFDFHTTGLYPIQCEISSDQSQVFVLNQFGDSVTVVNLATGKSNHLPLGPIRSPTDEERGEQLFHDSRLSHDGWMSCESCHSRGHTSSGLNDNLSDFSQGTPKRILSLLGQGETAPYSWFGAQDKLEDQVASSIRSTMASDYSVKPTDVAAITSFIASLPRPPNVDAARRPKDLRSKQVAGSEVVAGKLVFESQGCADCHTPPLYTSSDTFDVALSDEQGNREFNPPSLLAVSQREGALFHDCSARSLEQVVKERKHQIKKRLSPEEADRLIAFLRSL